MQRFNLRLAIVASSVFLCAAPGFCEVEKATNETLEELFGKQHRSVMTEQQKRIHHLLDAFLLGDPELIQTSADEIASAMNEISRTFPPAEGKEEAQWTAMAGVIQHARALKANANKGDFDAAYQSYFAMTSQCIQCHQERRDWGIFPKPLPEKKAGAGKKVR